MFTTKTRATIAGSIIIAFGIWTLAEYQPAAAQELPQATKRENSAYYEASFTKFKPGKAAEAYSYIYEHFVPVDNKIGRAVEPYDLQTGEWDHVVFFPLSEGPAEFGWVTSPTDEKWWAAFAEQEGGADEARALMEKFLATIARQERHLAHRHLPDADD